MIPRLSAPAKLNPAAAIRAPPTSSSANLLYMTRTPSASNLPFGSSVIVIVSVTGSPDPRQRPFGPRQLPVSGQLSRDDWRRASLHVPASCSLSAVGRLLVGSSCSRPGTGPSLRSAYRAPPGARTRTGLPRSAPARYDRAGCPLYPGDGGARPGRMPCPAVACRFPAASPCTPQPIPPAGLLFTRHQRGFTRFTRPACPSPVVPRMGREPLGLSPVLRTPPLPAAHDRAGPGVSTRPELRCRHNRPSNPRVHSQGATSCRNGR